MEQLREKLLEILPTGVYPNHSYKTIYQAIEATKHHPDLFELKDLLVNIILNSIFPKHIFLTINQIILDLNALVAKELPKEEPKPNGTNME